MAAPPEPGESQALGCAVTPEHLLVHAHGQPHLLPVRVARGAKGPSDASRVLFYAQAADHSMQERELRGQHLPEG